MNQLLYEQESYAIRGAVFEVYRSMGCGFLEPVYQECLEREFEEQHVVYMAQQQLTLLYKGQPPKQTYIPDFVCFGLIIVEIKAVNALTDEHRAQVLNYLKATWLKVGLLVNFGHFPQVEIERFVA